MRLALGEAAPVDMSGAEGLAANPLAKRELEVAGLVAEGLSNKQIGVRLFISEATVASHIRHIMDKFGVNSRSQIAVLMTPRPTNEFRAHSRNPQSVREGHTNAWPDTARREPRLLRRELQDVASNLAMRQPFAQRPFCVIEG